jgi:starch phosphorylase
VEAGFDRFPSGLIEHYLRDYCDELGCPVGELLALGQGIPADPAAPFNMAYLAMRGSGAVNGVSRLHGEVSRRIFQPLFPRWPQREVPVGYVTNGVHVPSWDSSAADEFWTRACGRERWRDDATGLERGLTGLPDEDYLTLRTEGREQLVRFARERLKQQLAETGPGDAHDIEVEDVLDPNVLTLCFARRFAAYKRPDLLLHDPSRLARLLGNRQQPLQLVIAGKAHPRDEVGRGLVRSWNDFIRDYGLRKRVVFLSDYDMMVAEKLVQGADVWLNTPRRPWEASGTSGMKVLVNGGLNLSELDGWWAEAWRPELGWALGDGLEHGTDPAWDAADADALYQVLEREVVPCFYAHDASGVPQAWLAKMRASVTELTPRFSANRMLREYVTTYYAHLGPAYRRRAASDGRHLSAIESWRGRLDAHWARLRFGALEVTQDAHRQRFRVPVYLDDLGADDISAELYAEPLQEGDDSRVPMSRAEPLPGSINAWYFTAEIAATRPAQDYTPRVRPSHPGVAIPLEAGHILWQR